MRQHCFRILQGATELFVEKNNNIAIPVGIEHFRPNAETIVWDRSLDAGEITIDLNKHTVLRFVGDAEQFVNRKFFCGKYVGRENQKNVFLTNQVAIFLGSTKIKYTIGLKFI